MAFRILFLCLVFLNSCLLAADVEKFLKPALNKSDQNRMEGIDFIYMINLDKRPEKFTQSSSQLQEYEIYPYRFSAVNGWELSIEALDSVGTIYRSWMPNDIMGTCYLKENEGKQTHEMINVPGRNYYSHCLSKGAIGIVLSHMSILRDAYDSGYETIWVMEDDIEVKRDPHELTDLIIELDELVGKGNWDILFTDPDTKNKDGTYIPCTGFARKPNFDPEDKERFGRKEHINEKFTKVGARYGAYSMIVRRTGMKKLLHFIRRYGVFLPFDMEYCLPNDINLYSLRYDVVSTLPRALSDNGAPRYGKNKK